MARFISRLIGSDTLANHDIRAISDGAAKRSGLIASRSAVSADIYDDLETVYENGSGGTYFPPDTFVITDGILTGSVYTSSLTNPDAVGIRTPAVYSSRPTASIRSNQNTLVGPSATSDSASVNYNVYLSASNAVRTTLDSITDGGPFGRLGQNPSRTLHSVWHDPLLTYFAWDDFSPGTASLSTAQLGPYTEFVAENVMFITSSTTTVSASLSWVTEYLADPLGQTDVTARLSLASNNSQVTSSNLTVTAQSGVTWQLSSATGLNNTIGDNPVSLHLTASTTIFDSTIPTHQGQLSTSTFSNLPVKAWRLITYNTRLYALEEDQVTSLPNALLGACRTVTVPVYASLTAGSSVADNPNGSNIPNSKKVFSSIIAPATTFNPFSDAPFWLIQSTGAQPATGDQVCKFNANQVQPNPQECYSVLGFCSTITNL